jgi:NAD(P)-dependent dehydrogenase (short-subunit alcohol dehydrogenase family)
MASIADSFSLKGKVAVVTGGAGVLGSRIAEGLGTAGAKVLILDVARYDEAAAELGKKGVDARGMAADLMDRTKAEAACAAVLKEAGRIDVLVNAAGGNIKEATTSPELKFFDMPTEALSKVVSLNLFAGAVIPAQTFGKAMAGNPEGGSIINISSMNAFRPLTRIAGYSAAKAAVSNFTQWLAVHMAMEYNKLLRVNAIAPGFFLTNQNRFLLTTEAGELTARGKSIIGHTPMGRFGDPKDLMGAVLWLASDASRFVTGAVVPIDGGFNAYSGV